MKVGGEVKAFGVSVATLLLAGCATAPSVMTVTYDSEPRGATLYQNGKPMGTTPVTLQYAVDKNFKAGGCMQKTGTEVKWASGVTANLDSLSLCAKDGRHQQLMYVRPDVPGREIDANFSLQLQRNQIMQNANAIQQMKAARAAEPVRCVSRQVGFTVRTVCQ
jgi:hypothetical protein